eukprot:NODE_36_length_36011_cov_1.012920.p12 type:complete len:343 gc:universal NODE_36_length_36011_cov_1.012920:6905-5877(-)
MIPLTKNFTRSHIYSNWLQLINIFAVSLSIYQLKVVSITYVINYAIYHQLWFAQLLLTSRYIMHPFIDTAMHITNLLFLSSISPFDSIDPLTVTILFILTKLILVFPFFVTIFFYRRKHLISLIPLFIACLVEFVLWGISIDNPNRLYYWGVGTILEKLASVYALSCDIPTSFGYFNEKFSLFTISLLGMGLFSIVTKINYFGESFQVQDVGLNILYCILIFAFWHNYYYCTKLDRVETKFSYRFIWIVVHLLLNFFMSLFGENQTYSIVSISGMLFCTSIANCLDIEPGKRIKLILRVILGIFTMTCGYLFTSFTTFLIVITSLFVVLMIVEHLIFIRIWG